MIGKREGGGFPRAGLGGADEIAPFQNQRNGAQLNRRGLGVTRRVHAFNDFGDKPSLANSNRHYRQNRRASQWRCRTVTICDTGALAIDPILKDAAGGSMNRAERAEDKCALCLGVLRALGDAARQNRSLFPFIACTGADRRAGDRESGSGPVPHGRRCRSHGHELDTPYPNSRRSDTHRTRFGKSLRTALPLKSQPVQGIPADEKRAAVDKRPTSR